MTTEQLRALLFPSISRAQHRLLHLRDLGLLWRTQPYRAEGGSKPFHYLLGYRGVELHAAQHGRRPPRPATHADRIRRLVESPRLQHLLGVNQFFADLADYCKRTGLSTAPGWGGHGLHTWRSEESITEFYYEQKITPDGYGCWHEHGQWLGFFLEHDTGTEPIPRVAAKLDRYAGADQPHVDRSKLANLAGMVLIWTSSHRREVNLRRAILAKHSVIPVATAAREHGDPDGPAGEVWSVVTAIPEQARRVRLGDLPSQIGGTNEIGSPLVLTELAKPTPPAPAPDRYGIQPSKTTNGIREANQREQELDAFVPVGPDAEATNPPPVTVAQPRVRSPRNL